MSQQAYAPSSEVSRGAPSKVIHARGVTQDISREDLQAACEQFGAVANIVQLTAKSQALIQFAELSSATNFLETYSKTPLMIHDHEIVLQYSNHQELRATSGASETPDRPGSRVLFITIINPVYQVDVTVLSQIFSPYETHPRGTVEKISIFKKDAGLQALVQFSNPDSAMRAKAALDRKNIYSKCNMLSIQFSKLSEITVKYNNTETFDFTNPSLPTERPQRPDPVLGHAGAGAGAGPRGAGGVWGGDAGAASGTGLLPLAGGPGMRGGRQEPAGQQAVYGVAAGGAMGAGPGAGAMGGAGGEGRCVLIVSGYPPERIGIVQLFNLFSNYGSVVRIKTLKDKPNTALVQFATEMQATTAMVHFKAVRLFGQPLAVNYSRFAFISPDPFHTVPVPRPARPYAPPVPPGATAAAGAGPAGQTMEFEATGLNRFGRPAAAEGPAPGGRGGGRAEHTVAAPTDVLHVGNLAAEATEESLRAAFDAVPALGAAGAEAGAKGGACGATAVRIFEAKERKMALVQFASIDAACTAMAAVHNTVLHGRSLRLSFTRSRL